MMSTFNFDKKVSRSLMFPTPLKLLPISRITSRWIASDESGNFRDSFISLHITSYGAIAVDLNYKTKWIGSHFNINLNEFNKSLYHHERVERDFPFNFKYSEKLEAINQQRQIFTSKRNCLNAAHQAIW